MKLAAVLGRRMCEFGLLSLLTLTPATLLYAQASAADSKPFFDAALTDLQGQETALSGYRGKPLIINFWARICGPCRTELPALNALYQAHAAQGLNVVGVAIEEPTKSVRDFVAAYQLEYPMVAGREEGIRLMQQAGNEIAGLPFTVVIDRDGNIVQQKIGAMTEQEMQQAVETLLK